MKEKGDFKLDETEATPSYEA